MSPSKKSDERTLGCPSPATGFASRPQTTIPPGPQESRLLIPLGVAPATRMTGSAFKGEGPLCDMVGLAFRVVLSPWSRVFLSTRYEPERDQPRRKNRQLWRAGARMTLDSGFVAFLDPLVFRLLHIGFRSTWRSVVRDEVVLSKRYDHTPAHTSHLHRITLRKWLGNNPGQAAHTFLAHPREMKTAPPRSERLSEQSFVARPWAECAMLVFVGGLVPPRFFTSAW